MHKKKKKNFSPIPPTHFEDYLTPKKSSLFSNLGKKKKVIMIIKKSQEGMVCSSILFSLVFGMAKLKTKDLLFLV